MKISAVAFDMDGLMFDTERMIQKAWEITGYEMGFPKMGEFIYQTLGINEQAARMRFEEEFGAHFPYDEFRTRERAYRQKIIASNGFPVKTGLRELLEYLKIKNIPCVVATSTDTEVADGYLQSEGLSDYFQGVIGGDQVCRSKPDPEIYLKACAFMGVDPAHCMALEDSYAGICAAFAGGLIPVMVPDLVPPNDEIRGKLFSCVASLHEVIPLLEQQ